MVGHSRFSKWLVRMGASLCASMALLAVMSGVAVAGVNQWTSSLPSNKILRSVSFSPGYGTTNKVAFVANSFNNGSGFMDAEVWGTTDGGVSWTKHKVVTPLSVLDVSSVSVAGNGTTVYASVGAYSNYGNIYEGGVYKSIDGGTTWARTSLNRAVHPSVLQVWSVAVAANGVDVFAGTNDGVWYSSDGGTSWTHELAIGANQVELGMSPNFSADGAAYAGLVDSGATVYLYKRDSGGSWGVSDWYTSSLAGPSPALAVSQNPASAGTVYYGSTGNDIRKTINAGAIWSDVPDLPTDKAITSIALASQGGSAGDVYVGTMFKQIWSTPQGGVYRSFNGGNSWSLINNGLTNVNVTSVAVPPNYLHTYSPFYKASAGPVWAATWAGGVFEWRYASSFSPWPYKPSNVLSRGPVIQSNCTSCHGSGKTAIDAHSTHKRRMWLSFVDKPGENDNVDGCGKCHTSLSISSEGDPSYTDPGYTGNLRRNVDPLVCVSCHGRFKASVHVGNATATVSTSCVVCHVPGVDETTQSPSGGAFPGNAAKSAAYGHTGDSTPVSWINPTYINATTVSSICLLCHGSTNATGPRNRVYYQAEDGDWPQTQW